MRKLAIMTAFLAALGAATAAPALAQQKPEHWVVVGMKGGSMGWDTSTLDVDEETGAISIDRLLYFATPRKRDNRTYNFEGQSIAFRCKDKQFQLLGILFMENDGFIFDGGAPQDQVWEPVKDMTTEGILWEAVCNKATILKTKIYNDLDSAMAGTKAQTLPE